MASSSISTITVHCRLIELSESLWLLEGRLPSGRLLMLAVIDPSWPPGLTDGSEA